MLRKIFSYLDSLTASPIQALTGISAIILIRTFLENFSNPEPAGIFSPVPILLNYYFFYTAIFCCFVVLIYILTKRPIKNILGIMAVGFFIIVTPPIWDLILSGGKGFCMGYIGESGMDLFQKFFLLMFQNPLFCGLTPGIKIEAVMVMIGIGTYVGYTTKKFWKGLLGAIGAYTIVFIFGAMPGIIATIANVPTNEVFNFFSQSVNGLAGSILDGTSIILGRIQWIATLLISGIIWMLASRNAWRVWWQGSLKKIPHLGMYLYIAIFGAVISIPAGGIFINWVSITGYITLALALFMVCWSVSITNDIEDLEIDKISNPDRPLVSGEISVEQIKTLRTFVTLFAATGALLINYNVFACMMVFIAAYYAHSAGPRLKKHWLTSGFLIGIAASAIMLVGYFSTSTDQVFAHFPLMLIVWIVLGVMVVNPIKDIHDAAGDKAGDIQTLPILIGTRATLWITAIATIAWAILFHAIVSWILVGIIAIGFIVGIIYFEITKKLPAKHWLIAIVSGGLFIPMIVVGILRIVLS